MQLDNDLALSQNRGARELEDIGVGAVMEDAGADVGGELGHYGSKAVLWAGVLGLAEGAGGDAFVLDECAEGGVLLGEGGGCESEDCEVRWKCFEDHLGQCHIRSWVSLSTRAVECGIEMLSFIYTLDCKIVRLALVSPLSPLYAPIS